jgi:hypothetical protein
MSETITPARHSHIEHLLPLEHESAIMKKSISTPDVNESLPVSRNSYERTMADVQKLDQWY